MLRSFTTTRGLGQGVVEVLYRNKRTRTSGVVEVLYRNERRQEGLLRSFTTTRGAGEFPLGDVLYF